MPCAESAGLVDGLINLFAILNGKWGFLAFPCFIAQWFSFAEQREVTLEVFADSHGDTA